MSNALNLTFGTRPAVVEPAVVKIATLPVAMTPPNCHHREVKAIPVGDERFSVRPRPAAAVLEIGVARKFTGSDNVGHTVGTPDHARKAGCIRAEPCERKQFVGAAFVLTLAETRAEAITSPEGGGSSGVVL